MTRSPALRDHVAAGILEIAARVLAERGEGASMGDIAKAAGVARATLYRYFPNRDALLQALVDTATTDLATRIADAKPDEAPVAEALARLTRAVIAATSKYRALTMLDKTAEQEEQARVGLTAPFAALFARGAEEGVFRRDLNIELLIDAYTGLLEGAANRVNQGRLGVEEASAAITSIFLQGALADHGD
ncbi:helix-turn-helix domain-containing protein [Saccharomonospora sp. NPDC046836]|uniref:TetR/AcrR family transcriptional regulator n=1 Tax=Saccharomonospora sp. NPDC046836 TaxID=3156921 RepID=UPI0033CC67E4